MRHFRPEACSLGGIKLPKKRSTQTMKRHNQILLLALATTLPLSLVSAGNAGEHSKDEALIRAAMKKMVTASNNKDADGYVAFTDPAFLNMDSSGKETTHGKEERRAGLSKLFAQISSMTERSTAKSITFDKNGATVMQASDSSFSVTVGGRNRVFGSHATYRDFWVKTPSGWLEKRSRAISSKDTLDGQPVP